VVHRHHQLLSDLIRKAYPECATALDAWYRIVKHTGFGNFADLRSVFPNADPMGGFTFFNIGGNKVWLIAAVHYPVLFRQIIKVHPEVTVLNLQWIVRHPQEPDLYHIGPVGINNCGRRIPPTRRL
jgi:mRNA-degrading endonuclease HigB of HigAB toxin-antitoxin module